MITIEINNEPITKLHKLKSIFTEAKDSETNPVYTDEAWLPALKKYYIAPFELYIPNELIPRVIYHEVKMYGIHIFEHDPIYLN